MCYLVEYKVPRRTLSPASFLTTFSSDHNVVQCGNVLSGGVKGSMQTSKPHPFPRKFSSALLVTMCFLVEQSLPN